MSKKDLAQLFEQATDIDFDFRYMAAREMSEMIESGSHSLNEADIMKIIDVFINQLNDENKEIRGHAVRCLSKCTSHMSEEAVGKAIGRIFDNFNKDDIDIYSTCFKTIVNLIEPHQYHFVLKNSIPILVSFIKSDSVSDQAIEESIEIFASMISKFSTIIIADKSLLNIIKDEHFGSRILGMKK